MKTIIGVIRQRAHASRITPDELRIFVHFKERDTAGKNFTKEDCLVPYYHLSSVTPRDRGAIPLNRESFKKWYINVRAFHSQKAICEEPAGERPSDEGFYCSTPTNFPSRSVLAIPLQDRSRRAGVIGTLTIDSDRSMADLSWLEGGLPARSLVEVIGEIADNIVRIHCGEMES